MAISADTIQIIYTIKMKLYVFLFFIFFCSCSNYFYPPLKENIDFMRIINTSNAKDSTNLLFNGYYNNETDIKNYIVNNGSIEQKSIPIASRPLFFFKNGLVHFSLTYYHNEITSIPSAINKYGERNWGTYEVIGDTIKAVIYCQFNNKSNGLYCYMPCYFSGLLSNREVIENWRMVSPIPDIVVDANKYRLNTFQKPSTLRFKHAGGKNKFNIDSNAVWINQFRIKKT